MSYVNAIKILIMALTSVLAITNFNSKSICSNVVLNKNEDFVCKIINS